MLKQKIFNKLKQLDIVRELHTALLNEKNNNASIPEILDIGIRKSEYNLDLRLNLVIPSVNAIHVFGGISTALNFFSSLMKNIDCSCRIITVDAAVNDSVVSDKYHVVNYKDDVLDKYQLVSFSDRYNKTIPVMDNDIFIATSWWTAYNIKKIISKQNNLFKYKKRFFIYLIQDYEPGFYAWSSRYALAESTYYSSDCYDIYAVINSVELMTYMQCRKYVFKKMWCFNPVFNKKIRDLYNDLPNVIKKEKVIIIYGRPSVERNAFSLIVEGVRKWMISYKNANAWKIYSAGESHDDITISTNNNIVSVGKLTLDEYVNLLKKSYIGISLMISPHPSYPPLEMATFGIKTITNKYENKDLSYFSPNIYNLMTCTPECLSDMMTKLADKYSEECILNKETDFVNSDNNFELISREISKLLKE